MAYDTARTATTSSTRIRIRSGIAALALTAFSGLAQAQATPVGLWKSVDDDGKTEKSLVRIVDTGGVLNGKVEKIFDPARQAEVCDNCKDERKGQRVLGMTIIRNAKKSADGSTWEGGDITDPGSGTVYKLKLKPIEGGAKLEVRGFVGIALLGRTQTWVRVE